MGGAVELVSDWTLSRRLARCRSAPISGASHLTEGPEEALKEAAVGQEKPGVPFPQVSRGPGEGLPPGYGREAAGPAFRYPFPGARWHAPRGTFGLAQAPPSRPPADGRRTCRVPSIFPRARPKGKVQASVVPSPQPRLLRGRDSGSLSCSSALTTRRTMIAGTLLLEEWYLVTTWCRILNLPVNFHHFPILWSAYECPAESGA